MSWRLLQLATATALGVAGLATLPGAAATGSADLSLTVTAQPNPSPAVPDGSIAYLHTVHNAGPDTAQSVKLDVELPRHTNNVTYGTTGGLSCSPSGGELTCTLAGLTAGADATVTVNATVDEGTAPGTIPASGGAAYSTTTADPDTANNAAASGTSVCQACSADLSLLLGDTPDPATAGANVTYTFFVTNQGPNAAGDVRVTGAAPRHTTPVTLAASGGLTCAEFLVSRKLDCRSRTLAAGAQATGTMTEKVDSSTPGGTVLTNVASVFSPSIPDPNFSNNTGVATTAVGGAAPVPRISR